MVAVPKRAEQLAHFVRTCQERNRRLPPGGLKSREREVVQPVGLQVRRLVTKPRVELPWSASEFLEVELPDGTVGFVPFLREFPKGEKTLLNEEKP